MKAQIFARKQKAKTGRRGWSGPNCYVAVIVRPDHLPEWPSNRPLNSKWLAKQGYEFRYCGEGYAEHDRRSSSMLNRAWARAEAVKREVESA